MSFTTMQQTSNKFSHLGQHLHKILFYTMIIYYRAIKQLIVELFFCTQKLMMIQAVGTSYLLIYLGPYLLIYILTQSHKATTIDEGQFIA